MKLEVKKGKNLNMKKELSHDHTICCRRDTVSARY